MMSVSAGVCGHVRIDRSEVGEWAGAAGQTWGRGLAGAGGARVGSRRRRVPGVMGVWAVELHPGQDVTGARDRLLDAGIVVRPIPPSTLAVCPPFVIGSDELEQILAALRSALA